MSREQNPRRKPIDSARRDKAQGHQTRRAAAERNRREGSTREISDFSHGLYSGLFISNLGYQVM